MSQGRNQLILWTILLVSFAIKIYLILTSGKTLTLDSDDVSYLKTAEIWLETGVFTYNDPTRPTVFITPALPAIIALFMKIIGNNYALTQTLRIVQSIMMVFSMYMLFIIGRRIWNERVALWGVGLSSLYLPLWHVSFLILTEALFICCLMMLIYSALRAMESPTWKWALLFGFWWVAATYARPTIALWPGIFLYFLFKWRQIPWQKVVRCGAIAAIIFIVGLVPWWVRNYEVSGGQFIPLTKSSGNPLLLGTFPYDFPPVAEQRTWHQTDDLWVNDDFDKQWAIERMKTGFIEQPLLYISWYTFGKFCFFWGGVFYWIRIANIPPIYVWSSHYILILLAGVGGWRSRHKQGAKLLISLFAYMTVLHMIYLAHGRYAVVLIPFVALFAGAAIEYLFDRSDSKGK
ncbi:glycosyltransferase family 39 protein [Paenibacillus sp. N1-5-1-14]|uniref:ArnT family glycosyltransferase n=1 Tax=Paenibacillus radicibacter TaxID=2972488 RepID=UPI0021597295|nr:glycosyltransferase family 39 protein [Paenibacillus radicibacter]MCR8645621.1 glycosyltransferase family 39 protein [Paenibacillus radicibacter]